jgi:hypothetical protein
MQIGQIEGTSEWFGTFRFVAGARAGDLNDRRIDLLPWTDGGPAILSSPEDGTVWQLQPLDATARTALVQARAAGAKAITSLAAGENSKIVLRVQTFQRAVQFPASTPLVVLVTEAVEPSLPEWAREQGIISFLQREFLAFDVAFAMMGEGEHTTAFRLIGSRFVLDCRIGKLGHPQTIRLDRKRRDVDSDRISLLRGAIRFDDARLGTTQLTAIRDLTAQLQSDDRSFFGMWKVYQELSETLLEQQSLEAGSIRYQRVSAIWENGSLIYAFVLLTPPHPAVLNDGVEVELAEEDAEDKTRTKKPIGQVLSRKPTLELRVLGRPGGEGPPQTGVLRICRSGDRVMLKRRKEALERLRQQRTELPTLAQLLEQGDAPVAQPRTWQPFSDRVRRVLPNPTEQQKHALDVALNTPDIALVQGPPGTGKTTIIRALMTRMSELRDQNGVVGSRAQTQNAPVLITSEQHDAVQNVVDGFDAGGLPAYRYSRRRDESRLEERELDRWVAERIASCREHLRQYGATPARILARDAERLVLQWRETDQNEEKKSCLSELLSRCASSIPPEMVARLVTGIQRLSPPPVSVVETSEFDQRLRDRLQTIVAGQPRTDSDYESTGLLQTGRLITFLEKNIDVLNRPIPELLRQAAQGKSPFSHSADAWAPMLESLLAGPSSSTGNRYEPDSEMDGLLPELLDHLRARAHVGSDGIVDAVEAFAEELEDPAARRTMISRYARVVAATCQQSVSKVYEDGDPDFEVVIVDEAARANPLDLLIPLSRGKRIVLVGDHKQLPQMLEPDVIESYRALHPEFDAQLLQQSLFERLFDLFKKAEQRGAPTRAVMLTDDFRMHPSISRLVSSLFYASDVNPRCTAEARAHGLTCYGPGPFCWVDVPIKHSAESGEQSKRRECEARLLTAELERILAADPTASVGVITFYERQAAVLADLCAKLPGSWQDRIRTGTVDAFQGREFDIVLLSTVRSNRESSLRRRVGFLAYPNRLCVAFSRARKLLITVGDSETIAGSAERPIIPEFQALLAACQGKEGTYVRR